MKCGFALQQQPMYDPATQKSKLTAGLLGIFLGGFGVHNFYLGYTGKAIAQILLSCVGIGAIWGFIEGILILTGNIDKTQTEFRLKTDCRNSKNFKSEVFNITSLLYMFNFLRKDGGKN